MDSTEALKQIRIAGFHGERQHANRIFNNTRISWWRYVRAYADGVNAKAGGVVCTCPKCSNKGVNGDESN